MTWSRTGPGDVTLQVALESRPLREEWGVAGGAPNGEWAASGLPYLFEYPVARLLRIFPLETRYG